MADPNRKHEKLTEIKPPRGDRPFKMNLRMPGWFPDFIQDMANPRSPGAPEPLYVEEVLKAETLEDKKTVLRTPFQPPLKDLNNPEWILGKALHEKKRGNAFSEWVHEISK